MGDQSRWSLTMKRGSIESALRTLRRAECVRAKVACPSSYAWLVEGLWPSQRQLHIFAARKTGKSLVVLWVTRCLAVGVDPFSGEQRPPIVVTYLDHEMTEDDVLERCEAMGFRPEQLNNLRYYLLPSMPPLDTSEGGDRLMQLVDRDHSKVVVVDTLARAVRGEENSNDTSLNFFLHTGRRLKKAGVALARLDDEGHTPGHARGASSKADDADIVWRLHATDDGVAFVRNASRVSWVPERIALVKHDEPLSYSNVDDSWPAGTKAKADELDQLDAPIDVSRRQAVAILKAAEHDVGRIEVLAKAIKYRKTREITLGNHR